MESEKLDAKKQELKQKQKEAIKNITKKTLNEINKFENKKNFLQEHIKILKHDLYDLKDGRLDRIAERHKVSDHCAAISVFKINKKGEDTLSANSWYEEYSVWYIEEQQEIIIILNNSVAKLHASGSYKLDNGEIKHL